MAAEIGDALTEIEYRAHYLRDNLDAPRDEILEELAGIIASVGRQRAVLERAISAAQRAMVLADRRVPPRRPELRLVPRPEEE